MYRLVVPCVLLVLLLGGLSPASAQSPSNRSLLESARGDKEKCRVVAAWVNKVTEEHKVTFTAMDVFRRFDLVAPLFRDKYFVPVFGRPYDQTTKEWRLGLFQKNLQKCQLLAARDATLSGLTPFLGMIEAAFDYANSARFGSEPILQGIPQMRAEERQLQSLVTESSEDLAGTNRSLDALKVFFPSEIAAAKAASAANRKRDTAELAAGLRDAPLAGNVDFEIEQCQDRGQANVKLTLRVADTFEMPDDPTYAATLERLLPEVQKKCSHTTQPVRALFVRNFVSDTEVNNVLADAGVGGQMQFRLLIMGGGRPSVKSLAAMRSETARIDKRVQDERDRNETFERTVADYIVSTPQPQINTAGLHYPEIFRDLNNGLFLDAGRGMWKAFENADRVSTENTYFFRVLYMFFTANLAIACKDLPDSQKMNVPILKSVQSGGIQMQYFNGSGFPIATVDLPNYQTEVIGVLPVPREYGATMALYQAVPGLHPLDALRFGEVMTVMSNLKEDARRLLSNTSCADEGIRHLGDNLLRLSRGEPSSIEVAARAFARQKVFGVR